MKKRELTPLEQILENTLLDAEERVWDSMLEVAALKDDIEQLQEFIPRLDAIYKTLIGAKVEMATIRIDMDKRKSKSKKRSR